MGKKPKVVIDGEMTGKPSYGFRWARTATRMKAKFEDFERPSKFKGGTSYKPFATATEAEFKDDGKFSMTITMSHEISSSMSSPDWSAWNNVLEVIDEFESYCSEQLPKSAEDATKMAEKEPGVLDLAFITKVKLSEE